MAWGKWLSRPTGQKTRKLVNKMDIFKELIKQLIPILKSMGLSKKGNSFYLEAANNYGILNFQKSRESTKSTIKFTINLGIYSDVLGQFQYGYNSSVKPEVEQCHWEARVGNLMPGSPDHWWIATSDNLSEIICNVIETVKNIIMPELNKRLSDEGLIDSWTNDYYTGTTEIGRFKYLTILLKAKKDFDTLNQVVDTFMQRSKGKVNASLAMEHLNEIKYIK